MAKTRWYNPLTWRMFGYNDPKTGDYVEVDMSVGGKQTQSGERMTPKKAVTVPALPHIGHPPRSALEDGDTAPAPPIPAYPRRR